LQKLATEVGVEMQNLTTDGGDDLYFFKGVFHTPTDMIDPAKKSGAFAPIAKRIAKDAAKLTDADENWTSYASKLDRMSLKDYLEQFRGKTDDWAIDLLDVAYNIEYGLETKDQSSLNMVDFITTDLSRPFSMFGVSDEVFRIKGGSSAIEMKQGFALTELDQKDKQIVMSFEAPGGAQSASFDAVILALPFTKLRQVKGLEGLKLGAEKLKCIRELGYGINAKIMNGTTSRVWRAPTRAFPRRRTAPSTPISASRLSGRRPARSPAKPASSPTIWAPSLA